MGRQAVVERDFYTARLRAVDASTGYPYLWIALSSLIPVVTGAVPTLATDQWWRCYINPTFFGKLTEEQGAACLVHEVWHPLGLDWVRAEGVGVAPEEQPLWNIARDIELNAKDELVKRLPTMTWVDEGVAYAVKPCVAKDFDLPDGLFAEEMFERLKKSHPHLKAERSIVVGVPMPGSGNCGGCVGGGKKFPWELPGPSRCDTPGQSEARSTLIQTATAQKILEASRAAGSVPAGWVRWAKETLNPRVSWREELPPAIRGSVAATAGRTHTTWQKLGRRQASDPRILNPSRLGVVQRVALIVDTSGSMSDHYVAQACAEVDGVLRALGRAVTVSVYFTDAATAEVQKVTSAQTLRPIGGGGTDMGAGFQAIADAAAKSPDEDPDLIICVTDGYTPWPENAPESRTVMILLGENAPDSPDWAKPTKHKTIRVIDF